MWILDQGYVSLPTHYCPLPPCTVDTQAGHSLRGPVWALWGAEQHPCPLLVNARSSPRPNDHRCPWYHSVSPDGNPALDRGCGVVVGSVPICCPHPHPFALSPFGLTLSFGSAAYPWSCSDCLSPVPPHPHTEGPAFLTAPHTVPHMSS